MLECVSWFVYAPVPLPPGAMYGMFWSFGVLLDSSVVLNRVDILSHQIGVSFPFLYMSHIPVPARGEDFKNNQLHVRRTLAANRSVTSL